jgi:hypothetical protein
VATVGISSKPDEVHTPVTESVSNLLGTIDRAKYELIALRQRRSVPMRSESLGEIGKIQSEFPNFFF